MKGMEVCRKVGSKRRGSRSAGEEGVEGGLVWGLIRIGTFGTGPFL